jgi:hypothetical protein
MFDQVMGEEVRACEFFARSLTAGWDAVGNEVLKFQWEGWWRQDPGMRGERAAGNSNGNGEADVGVVRT